MNQYFNSYMKIDTDTVVTNFQKVQEYIGKDVGIIPLIKGNCYGYGLVPMAKLFEERCGARLIANAAVYEAVELRLAGVKSELLVIGGVPPHLLEAVVKYDLQMNLFDALTAKCLHNIAFKAGKKLRCILKLRPG